jgi:hypothetical protein
MKRSFSFTRDEDLTAKNTERCFSDHDMAIQDLLNRIQALETQGTDHETRITTLESV